ncbi:MAG TPA: hypothetical protein VMM80_11040 [Bacteroidota bacterium]|nr:hypothetical protein [Bacteroidota bacterium]
MARIPGVVFAAALAIVLSPGCSKDSSPPPAPTAPSNVLAAVPPWVAVGVGGIQHVDVSGGVPPYVIRAGPDSIARVEISSADSTTAILKITGLITSSNGTKITVNDHTPGTSKTVDIPVTVF